MANKSYRSYNGRTRSDKVHARRAYSNPETRARAAKKRENRLIVCLLIAAIFSITRLVFPTAFSGIKEELNAFIGKNIDLQSAVHVIGEAVSGEKNVSDAVAEAFGYAFGADAESSEETDEAESQKL